MCLFHVQSLLFHVLGLPGPIFALLRYLHEVEIAQGLLCTCYVEMAVGDFTEDRVILILSDLMVRGWQTMALGPDPVHLLLLCSL